MGWVQGLLERIVEVHVQARYEEMIAKRDGKRRLWREWRIKGT
jgi:hypothetical protein